MDLDQALDVAKQSILRRSSAWRVPLILAFISLLAALPGSTARLGLRYEQSAIAAGEWWRLVTGHVVHLGNSHLLLNLAGLVVVWLLVGSSYPQLRWGVVVIIAIVFMDLGFWFLDPGLEWYVGLSGLLHAMLVAGLVSRFREQPGESLALGVIVAMKIGWEQFAGPLPGSEASAGGPVVVNAHLYGAISGLIAAGIVSGRSRRTPVQ